MKSKEETTKDLGLKCKYGEDCSVCGDCILDIAKMIDDAKIEGREEILNKMGKMIFRKDCNVCTKNALILMDAKLYNIGEKDES